MWSDNSPAVSNKFMDTPPYGLWSIWRELSYLYRLFILILSGVSIYSLISVSRIMLRLRTLRKLSSNEDIGSIQTHLAVLGDRCMNQRQLIGATFYLFGCVFFVGLEAGGKLLENSDTSMISVLDYCIIHFAFVANVVLVFLSLHLVQWFVWHRLNTCHKDLKAC